MADPISDDRIWACLSGLWRSGYEPGDYAFLAEHVTAERVKALFDGIAHGPVTRYELPELGALNFVLEHAFGGGVTRSLRLDPHGRSLSSTLLELDIPDRQRQ